MLQSLKINCRNIKVLGALLKPVLKKERIANLDVHVYTRSNYTLISLLYLNGNFDQILLSDGYSRVRFPAEHQREGRRRTKRFDSLGELSESYSFKHRNNIKKSLVFFWKKTCDRTTSMVIIGIENRWVCSSRHRWSTARLQFQLFELVQSHNVPVLFDDVCASFRNRIHA